MIGNMVLVNSGFPHPKKCLRRLSTIGHALSKMFASPILGRKSSKSIGLKGRQINDMLRAPPCFWPTLSVETWLYWHHIIAHSSNVLAPLWSMVWSRGQLLHGSAPLSGSEPRNKRSLSFCVNSLRFRETLQRADYVVACIYVRFRFCWHLNIVLLVR